MKRYFLGLAADLRTREIWRHVFAVGREKDRERLTAYLEKKYQGKAILTKNGRSGLAIALKTYFKPGDGILVNGFTCYAVYEALRAAKVKPIWADISPRDLNFTEETLKAAILRTKKVPVKGIIVQNTLGNPVDMRKIERLAKKYGLTIIEDLAHSVGEKYADGREVGTVGAATVLSFGKDKVVDATSGGAVVLRKGASLSNFSGPEGLSQANPATRGRACDPAHPETALKNSKLMPLHEPNKPPKVSDTLRARFYPLFGLLVRKLTAVHLGGVLMRFLLKIHWVEKSADNRLDLTRKIAKFEAKLALERLKRLSRRGRRPIRSFYLVHNRDKVLAELTGMGYYFSGIWYERPVAPERYYAKVRFPEEDCPVATEVAREIVNLPNYYNARELAPARRLIESYEVRLQLTNRGVIEQIKEVAVKNAREGSQKVIGRLATKLTEVLMEEKRK